jgi:hypothetical protein
VFAAGFRAEAAMSSIRLTHREAEGRLPMVCMVCGNKATQRKNQTFRWSPMGLYWGFGGYGGLVSLALSKYKSVDVPLCDEDGNYFWKPVRGLLIIVGIFFAIFLMAFLVAPIVIAFNLPFFIPFLFAFGAFAYVIPTYIWYMIHIRNKYVGAAEIDDRGVCLQNVSSEFVRAVQRKRRSRDSEDDEDFIRRDVSAFGIFNSSRPAPRRRRRRIRDDDEDEDDDEE